MTAVIELTNQRYEAPTCVLEVTGEASSLGQLTGRPLLKRLRFRLQLLALDGSSALELHGMRSQLLSLQASLQDYLDQRLNSELASTLPHRPQDSPLQSPYFQAEGLTRQRLVLQSLAPASGPSSVVLTTQQLGDLTQVLEDFETAVDVLPGKTLHSVRSRRWRWAATGGIGAGAAALLVTVWMNVTRPEFNVFTAEQSTETLEKGPLVSKEAPQASRPIDPETVLPRPPLPDSRAADQPQVDIDSSDSAPAANTPEALAESRQAPRQDSSPPSAPTTAAPSPRRPSSPRPEQRTQESTAGVSGPSSGGAYVEPAAGASPPAAQTAQPPAADESDAPAAEPQEAATALAAPDEANLGVTSTRSRANASLQRPSNQTAWLETVSTTIQRRWQPPEDLVEPLIYELSVNGDGILTAITPLFEASESNHRLPITLGDAIAPPPTSQPQRLRLTLRPAGEVEVRRITD